MAVNSSTRLGCGRDIDDVWDNIHHAPDAHEATCPDCSAARDSLSDLVDATSRMHSEDDADAQLQASPQVLTRILDVARSEVRRGRRLPLSKPRPGEISTDLSVSEQAIVSVVRRACDRDPLVHLRRCRVELVTAPGDTVLDVTVMDDAAIVRTDTTVDDTGLDIVLLDELEPSDVRLFLRVSVDVTASIPQATRDLRRDLEQVMTSEVGMNVVDIEIIVEDVHHV